MSPADETCQRAYRVQHVRRLPPSRGVVLKPEAKDFGPGSLRQRHSSRACFPCTSTFRCHLERSREISGFQPAVLWGLHGHWVQASLLGGGEVRDSSTALDVTPLGGGAFAMPWLLGEIFRQALDDIRDRAPGAEHASFEGITGRFDSIRTHTIKRPPAGAGRREWRPSARAATNRRCAPIPAGSCDGTSTQQPCCAVAHR